MKNQNVIYMNNAATSWPKPPCVTAAVSHAVFDLPGAANRGGVEDWNVFSAVRGKLAAVMGVKDPERIALGANATWGLNLAIFGFPFKLGDTVVTTGAEHNSVLRPLYALEQSGLIKVVYLNTDRFGRVPVDRWREALAAHKPALCCFTHASNVTGAVNDAPAMAEAAHSVGAKVLLDASQTLGWQRVKAEDWGVDMLAFTGHKYLLGPQGTGGLWVRPGLELSPHLVGGTGVKSDLDTMPEEMPIHLEAGTGNEPSYHGLYAALDWAEKNPRDTIECEAKLNRLRSGLFGAGAEVIAPGGDCTPVVSFTLPNVPCEEVGFMLTESCDVICRTGLHCAPKLFPSLGVKGTVRLSLSRFTTGPEIEAVIRAVRDIA